MEDTGYIFVDIEWNQRAGTTTLPYREPVQIAIIETTEDLKFRKRFSQHSLHLLSR